MAKTASVKKAGGFSAKRLAQDLRKELLQLNDGDFFGYEDELLAKLNVSRPTLRQAARVLEHDQLLTVRRGPRGGYYAKRPNVQSVINAAALYLHGRGTRLRDLMEAARGCNATLIRLAAQSQDEEARAEVREKMQDYATKDFSKGSPGEFLRAENEVMNALARLAGNAPLELVIRILYGCGLGVNSDRIFDGRPDRIAACAEARVRVVEAVLAGDVEMAELLHARAADMRQEFLEEDARRIEPKQIELDELSSNVRAAEQTLSL